MKCRHCGFENPGAMVFCGGCGQPLKGYTPRFLARDVLASKEAIAGERKVVTVLFLDVAGFTSLSETLDPEDVHTIMNRCFEILGQEIHAVGGTINQYTGDGVMALFGAPQAHEDHCRRACAAALNIRDKLAPFAAGLKTQYQIKFQVRMGIHTGEVVIGAIGDRLRLDYTAVGDTTNVAARLESLASLGKIWVSESVKRAAEPFFQFRKTGSFKLKGKKQRVTVFSLTRERALEEVSRRLEKGGIPFVNRHHETRALKQVMETVVKGRTRFLSVQGEAGIGKTRLIQAFLLSQPKNRVIVLKGNARPYGRIDALHPIRHAVENGIIRYKKKARPISLPQQERICHTLSQIEASISRYGDIWKNSPDSNLSGEGEKRKAFIGIRDGLTMLCRRNPVILVIDDMQWGDATTQSFLSFFLASVQSAPILVICSGRGSSSDWGPATTDLLLSLAPLDSRASRRMAQILLGKAGADHQTLVKLVAAANGNPFFLIEMGHGMRKGLPANLRSHAPAAAQVSPKKMPDRIRDTLLARIDALQPAARQVCRVAAVAGLAFSKGLLLEVLAQPDLVHDGLRQLEKEEIIVPQGNPENGQYGFSHQMLQQAVYTSLLTRVRKTWHLQIALAIETLHQERLDHFRSLLSYHYYQAGEWPRAFGHTITAGHAAKNAFACQEALTCFDRALDILGPRKWGQPEMKAVQIYKWKGGMHFCLQDMAASRRAFEKMRSLAQKENHREDEMEALFRLGWVAFYDHRPGSAETYLSKALAKSLEMGSPEIQLKAGSLLGQLYSVQGQGHKARDLLIQSLDLKAEVDHPEGHGWCLAFLLQHYNWNGEFHSALEICDELAGLNRRLKSPYFNTLLHFRKGLIFGALGRLKEAASTISHGLDALEATDGPFWRPRLLNTLGWIHAEKGDMVEALSLNRRSLKAALPTQNRETINNARINIGENLIQLKRWDPAEKILLKTWSEVKGRRPGYAKWRYKTRLLIALAEFHRKKGRRRDAVKFAGKALDLAWRTGAQKHQARALEIRAKLYDPKRPALAVKALKKALHISENMGTRILSQKIKADLLLLGEAAGNGNPR